MQAWPSWDLIHSLDQDDMPVCTTTYHGACIHCFIPKTSLLFHSSLFHNYSKKIQFLLCGRPFHTLDLFYWSVQPLFVKYLYLYQSNYGMTVCMTRCVMSAWLRYHCLLLTLICNYVKWHDLSLMMYNYVNVTQIIMNVIRQTGNKKKRKSST